MKTVLIVEDSYATQEMLKKVFDDLGFNIICANNGIEALEFLPENNIDIIILDMVMPGMNGYEFFKKLKEKEEYKNIPVIISTTKGELEEYLELDDLKPDAFVEKPYSLSDFRKILQEVIDL